MSKDSATPEKCRYTTVWNTHVINDLALIYRSYCKLSIHLFA